MNKETQVIRSTKWQYFMDIAKAVSRRSPCLSRQVGCVLIDHNNHILSTGYNGPPSKIGHCETCTRTEPGRDLYKCPAVHAEMNALLQCRDVNLIKAVFITVSPCAICLRLLANTPTYYIFCDKVYTDESYNDADHLWHGQIKRFITVGDPKDE